MVISIRKHAGEDWCVWASLVDGDVTTMTESFVLGEGRTKADAIAVALKTLEQAGEVLLAAKDEHE